MQAFFLFSIQTKILYEKVNLSFIDSRGRFLPRYTLLPNLFKDKPTSRNRNSKTVEREAMLAKPLGISTGVWRARANKEIIVVVTNVVTHVFLSGELKAMTPGVVYRDLQLTKDLTHYGYLMECEEFLKRFIEVDYPTTDTPKPETPPTQS